MTASTRTTVLSLYMRVFRIARTWQAQSGVLSDTETERKYILQEARTLFRQNQKLTEQESIKKCIEECEARIEIGLHYRNPYPRAVSNYPLLDHNGSCCFGGILFAYSVCCRRIYHPWDWQLRRAGSCEHSSA
uniref:LYR motif containing 1 n=1 Tax=Oreochromis niloticus TaxID=8128 RepID=A0A669CQ74_ORENI